MYSLNVLPQRRTAAESAITNMACIGFFATANNLDVVVSIVSLYERQAAYFACVFALPIPMDCFLLQDSSQENHNEMIRRAIESISRCLRQLSCHATNIHALQPRQREYFKSLRRGRGRERKDTSSGSGHVPNACSGSLSVISSHGIAAAYRDARENQERIDRKRGISQHSVRIRDKESPRNSSGVPIDENKVERS